MRKILTASAVAVALVAGQAAAAGAVSQQSNRVADRIGAPMGDEDNQWQGFAGLGVGGSIVVGLVVVVALVGIVSEVTSDDEPVSG